MSRTIDTYTRIYKLRVTGDNNRTVEVSFPRDVVEREAKKRGMTVDEFIQKFRVVAHYDNFEGVFYTFQPVSSSTEIPEVAK